MQLGTGIWRRDALWLHCETNHKLPVEVQLKSHEVLASGFGAGSDFLSSILAGMLLGWLADRIFSTAPLLVVVGIIAGAATGFFTTYRKSKKLDDGAVSRTRPQ